MTRVRGAERLGDPPSFEEIAGRLEERKLAGGCEFCTGPADRTVSISLPTGTYSATLGAGIVPELVGYDLIACESCVEFLSGADTPTELLGRILEAVIEGPDR